MNSLRLNLAFTLMTCLLVAPIVPVLASQPINQPRQASTDLPTIVPTPKLIQPIQGAKSFQLSETSRIIYEGDQPEGFGPPLQELAKVLAGELELITGLKPAVVTGNAEDAGPHDILLDHDTDDQWKPMPEVEQLQSYTLKASSSGLTISASDYKGMCYGTASLLQAIDPQTLTVPPMDIDDHASAAYRAVMIDIARKPHSIGVIKDTVRLCRLYKVRYLHLHLTDDQHFTFPFAPVTDNLENNHCYTLQELRDLVAYADARGVTIIPEFDLPGHSSRLKQSGYLAISENDGDVADPANFDKINRIIDAMMDVFASSPYFHIGGDESGAGSKLVPFLQSVNKQVRMRDRRLLVWEGFHGAPTEQLPATGDDRIVVLAWESSYNAPWDLLNSGYEIINASWKPMYLVSGYGGMIHAGAGGGCKRFDLEDIYRWDKNTFMHWEPGRPVYEDRGPNDPDQSDHEWNAEYIGRQDLILGGQLLYWEQHECNVIHFLAKRVPLMSQRLWNPEAQLDYGNFQTLLKVANERVFPIVQPVEILPAIDQTLPASSLYQPYSGEELQVEFRNRTKIPGAFRFARGRFSGGLGAPNFAPVPAPDTASEGTAVVGGGFGIRAELVREDGTPVEGHTWSFYNNWPMRVEVTEFDIGERHYRKVPDLASLPTEKIDRSFEMPYIRGLLQNTLRRGQMTVTDFISPTDGEHTFELRTQSGHATLYVDLNQNGRWEEDEALIRDTPNTEVGQLAKATLRSGQRYRLRIDHATNLPRPVLILLVSKPGGERPTSIDKYLYLPQ